ncbi:MAG: hypothetical protein WC341_14280 [Bacteroidales bacterium]|jgi:hypothetical protein
MKAEIKKLLKDRVGDAIRDAGTLPEEQNNPIQHLAGVVNQLIEEVDKLDLNPKG